MDKRINLVIAVVIFVFAFMWGYSIGHEFGETDQFHEMKRKEAEHLRGFELGDMEKKYEFDPDNYDIMVFELTRVK